MSSDSLCHHCNHDITRVAYHRRICAQATVKCSYPDLTSSELGPVVEFECKRNVVDRHFWCIRCHRKISRDTDKIRDHAKKCGLVAGLPLHPPQPKNSAPWPSYPPVDAPVPLDHSVSLPLDPEFIDHPVTLPTDSDPGVDDITSGRFSPTIVSSPLPIDASDTFSTNPSVPVDFSLTASGNDPGVDDITSGRFSPTIVSSPLPIDASDTFSTNSSVPVDFSSPLPNDASDNEPHDTFASIDYTSSTQIPRTIPATSSPIHPQSPQRYVSTLSSDPFIDAPSEPTASVQIPGYYLSALPFPTTSLVHPKIPSKSRSPPKPNHSLFEDTQLTIAIQFLTNTPSVASRSPPEASNVSLKRSPPTPTSAPRKRPNNSSTRQTLHIPSTFGPISPETAPPPLPPATHYEFPRSAELQSIQALIIAYTNRDVCLVCHVTGDTQYPETHSLGRCRSRLAGAQDQTYKVWRQTAFNFEFGKECMGCGVPKDLYFSDSTNQKTQFLHHENMGNGCPWRETLRPVWYMVLHDTHLRDRFFASKYGRSFDPDNERLPFHSWLARRFDGPVSNYLALGLFILELRGMPDHS